MSQAPPDSTSIHPQLAALPHHDRYRFLASKHRRLTLDILEERNAPMSLSELAVEITDRDEELAVDKDGEVNRIEMMLYHQHLPQMDDLGIIDFDRDVKRITRPR